MYSFNLSTIQNKFWEFWVNIGHTVVPTSCMKFPRNYYRGALNCVLKILIPVSVLRRDRRRFELQHDDNVSLQYACSM
jgi:hypothetical protein